MVDWPYKTKYTDMRLSAKAVLAEFVAMTLFVFIGCGTAVFFSRISEDSFVGQESTGEAVTPGYLSNVTGSAPAPAPGLIPNKPNVAEQSAQQTKEQTKLLIGTLQANGNWGITTALAFGFAIMVLVYAFGHISGGQINCCVSLGLFLAGHLGPIQAMANFAAQMVGSILGAAFLYGVVPSPSESSLGSNAVSPDFTEGQALLGEAVMTFVLVLVVLQTATDPRALTNKANIAPFAIGMAVFLGHAVLLQVDGCSINPTRSFGPAVVAGSFHNFWVFWVGPLIGTLFAVPVYMLFRWPVDTVREDEEDSGAGTEDGKVQV